MTPLSPRLQSLFKKTETVCFGRFMIEVPVATEVIWGDTDVPLGVWVEKGGAKELNGRIAEVEAHLKSEPRYPLTKGLSLYLETIENSVLGISHVVSQQTFDGSGLLRINSFFRLERTWSV